jgi:hypothetical protein
MASSMSFVSCAVGSGKTVGGDGVNEILDTGVGSSKSAIQWRTLIRRRETSPTEGISLMEMGLRWVVSDFPVLHPASWVGIFHGAFLPPSSSLSCSTLDSLRLWLEIPSFPGSALGSHRLSRPFVFHVFWLGGSVHLPRIHPRLTWALLASPL